MYERMLDKNTIPTEEQLIAHCQQAGELFIELNDYLDNQLGCSSQIRFPYGNKYGWGICHRMGKKLICDVFAEAGSCNLMLRLTEAQFQEVYSEMSEKTRRVIDAKYPCGEGGWIHMRISEIADLNDAKKLLKIKCTPAKKVEVKEKK